MHKDVRNRVAEFKERFGPVLKELKLGVRVDQEEYYQNVRLIARKRVGDQALVSFSPVAIYFHLPSDRTGEVGWDAATLHIDHWYPKALGDTGWSHWRDWSQTSVKLDRGDDETFAWIESQIREYGSVNIPFDKQYAVDNDQLADAYWATNGAIKDLTVVKRISHPYFGLEEYLTFQDSEGQRVHMRFSDNNRKNVIFIDGKPIGAFSHHEPYLIARLAISLSKGRDEVESWQIEPIEASFLNSFT